MSRLDALRREQHDVLSRRQLADAGIDADHIARELVARRWQESGPLVVVLHNGPLTAPQRWWVATLSGGVLAAATALEGHGLTGYETVRTLRPPRRLSCQSGSRCKIALSF